MTTSANILVSGDVVVDHNIYQGERWAPGEFKKRGVRHLPILGGADALRALVASMVKSDLKLTATDTARGSPSRNPRLPPHRPIAAVQLGVVPPRTDEPVDPHHAFVVWGPHNLTRDKPQDGLVWRASTPSLMGYGHELPALPPGSAAWIPSPAPLSWTPNVLVLDDAGFEFRNRPCSACWHLSSANAQTKILLKLSDPIGEGALWHELFLGSKGRAYSDRLVCVISASDLRQEKITLGSGASWERTLHDLASALAKEELAPLRNCRHLVITFGGDGALWLQPSQPGQPARLCFAAEDAEGDFAASIDGVAVGYMTVMAASLAYGMSQAEGMKLDLLPWIEAGLSGMRDLHQNGHGPVTSKLDEQPNGFPFARIANTVLSERKRLPDLPFAWPPAAEATDTWSLIVESERHEKGASPLSLIGLAVEVARFGESAYCSLPRAKFENFLSMERSEIEMLRAIRQQMLTYRHRAKTSAKPLCIGVFGPPGAGKSYAVKEISKGLFGEEAWMEFNLAQFTGETEFNGALHQVRDRVLAGETPVVFWDEFDCRNFEWLRSMLAPMQDGRFQDKQLNHAVGKSVFIFAGGTAHRWADFGSPNGKLGEHELRLLKAPDFKSRLDAYYDVFGPNRRASVPDIGFTLRRALLIRGQLKLRPDQLLDMDTDLLRALLLAPNYNHGARSLEKLVTTLRSATEKKIVRSHLPPSAQLNLHVDAVEFVKLLDECNPFSPSTVETLANEIHEAYREKKRREAERPEEERREVGWRPIEKRLDQEYENLDVAIQQDNRAAAKRIPTILAMAGMAVVPARLKEFPPPPGPDDCKQHLAHHIDRLAEAEHNGWWETRRRNGWRVDERDGAEADFDKLTHPCMIPFDKLKEVDKERDREVVRNYADLLKKAGYQIAWMNDS